MIQRNAHLLSYLALAVYAVSWFVQVHKEGFTLDKGIPGYQAFRVALSPILPYGDFNGSDGELYAKVLYVTSGLTNFLVPIVLLLPGRAAQRLIRFTFIWAFLVNSHWVLWPDMRPDLRAGYYLWWFSFGAIALAATLREAPLALVGTSERK